MSKNKHRRDVTIPARRAGGLGLAAAWPVYETLISEGWDREAALVSILLARHSPKSGKVAAGLLLVDLACLGVKNAQVKLFGSPAEYAAGLRAHALSLQPMAPADFNLAAKIIAAGVEYAARLGFKPNSAFAQAQPLLAGADPAACATPVPTGGPGGKPLFVNGPYDDVDYVLAQLRRTVGEGNFDYLLGGDAAQRHAPN